MLIQKHWFRLAFSMVAAGAAPTAAVAQPSFVESFYVSATSEATDDDLEQGLSRCARSFADALNQSRQYIERNGPEVASVVSGCVENVADPTTQRACDLAAASSSVDYILMVDALQVSNGWLFEARAVSPTQNGTVWSADQVVDSQSDFVLSARQGCRELAQNFLCTRNNVCATAATAAADRSTLRLDAPLPTVATVYVDGVAVGNSTQAEFALTPGTKRIELRAPGYAVLERTVELVAGQTLALNDVVMEALPATASVACNVRDAQISVNGQIVASTALGQFVPVTIPIGASTLSVQAPGYNTWEIQLAATPGADLQLEVELTPGSGVQTGVVTSQSIASVPGTDVSGLPAGTNGSAATAAIDPSQGPTGVGGFSDSLSLYANTAGALQQGDVQLNSGEFYDEYFYMSYGNEPLSLRAASTEFDTYLMIRGPGDFTIDNDDYDIAQGTNAGIDIVLPNPGEYRIMVTSYRPGEVGSYTLSVAPGVPPATQTPVTPPTVGNQFNGSGTGHGSLASGDATLNSGEFSDTWIYQSSGNEFASLHALSTEFDTYLMVRGPNGFTMDNDDFDTAQSLNAGLEFEMLAPGEYRFIVTSYQPGETGAYALDFTTRSLVPATTGYYQQTQPVGGTPGGYQVIPVQPSMRATQLSGEAGGNVSGADVTDGQCLGFFNGSANAQLQVNQYTDLRIFAESSADTTLLLVDDAGNVYCDDDSHGNLNPRLDVSLRPGIYDVFVGTYAAGTYGDYLLTVQPL